MNDDTYPDLVERVYGRERPYPCEHGHFDCATFERGPCAGETLDRLIRAQPDYIDPARVTPTGPGHVTGVQP
jgi:hypothetical protein